MLYNVNNNNNKKKRFDLVNAVVNDDDVFPSYVSPSSLYITTAFLFSLLPTLSFSQ